MKVSDLFETLGDRAHHQLIANARASRKTVRSFLKRLSRSTIPAASEKLIKDALRDTRTPDYQLNNHDFEQLANLTGEDAEELKSLTEGRIKGATYSTKEVKGKIEKVIAELKGQHSSAWTKISKQYVELDTEIKKLSEQRDELNKELKDKATDVFDTEDEVLTRVVETAQLTLTLSKKVRTEAHPEVDAEGVVKALAEADLPKDLRKMLNGIIKANTKIAAAKETPERLTVKVNKIEESIGSTLMSIIAAVKSWFKEFDSKYSKISQMVKMI